MSNRNRISRACMAFAILHTFTACRPSEGAGSASGNVPAAPVLEPAFGTEGANSLRFPVWFGEVPGRPGAFLALERGGGSEDGRIYAFEEKDGKWVRKVFLTVPVSSSSASADERGLLGLAFHPAFPENRRYYLYYMPKSPGGPDSTVVDERRADASLLADGGGMPRRILGVEQPYSNHNGGSLAFGPKDGMLYIGLGDGGAGGDPHGNGQNLGTLLGKMLRIDVDDTAGGKPYGIPKDNPFVAGGEGSGGSKIGAKRSARGGGPARPEIWAYGLRNPWKWSFDTETGKLWAGDVGQNNKEEITLVGRGENLGWRRMEGFACFDPPNGCDRTGLTLPVVDLPRDDARCITGGYVYRGNPSSPWQGAYFFGDFETRYWWAIMPDHKGGELPRRLGRLPDQPSSFGQDSKGGLYMVGYGKGIIYRIRFP